MRLGRQTDSWARGCVWLSSPRSMLQFVPAAPGCRRGVACCAYLGAISTAYPLSTFSAYPVANIDILCMSATVLRLCVRLGSCV